MMERGLSENYRNDILEKLEKIQGKDWGRIEWAVDGIEWME